MRRPKNIWKNHVEDETKRFRLKEEDAMNVIKWGEGMRAVVPSVSSTWPPPLMGKPGMMMMMMVMMTEEDGDFSL